MTPRRRRSPALLFALPMLALGCDGPTDAHDDENLDEIEVDTPWGTVDMGYRVANGHVIVEGDIDLGPVETVLDYEAEGFRAAGRADSGARWPNGVVYYTLDPGLPLATVANVFLAISHWEASTSIELVPRTTEPNYVTFRQGAVGSACASSIGMVGVKQFITLEDTCGQGEIIHEIGHAVGLWHEHTRTDRDDHVDVDLSCVKFGEKSNYKKYITGGFDGRDLGPYDVDSIMQYSTGDFCKTDSGGDCVCDTITLPDGSPITANRSALSPGDLDGIAQMYGRRDFDGAGSTGDRFGTAMACGDFDGDGYVDLAIGAPRVDDIFTDVGRVYLYEGIGDDKEQLTSWHTIEDLYPERTGRLGAALAAGDFNGDGIDDLAIGAPFEDYAATPEAGLLYLYAGAEQALENIAVDTLQGVSGVAPQANGHFAAALAAGDFDCDGIDEIAIGAPGELNAGGFPSGAVHIADYDPTGAGAQDWDRVDPDHFGGSGGNPAEFGFALAAGDIDGDGCDDLVVGVPNARTFVTVPGGVQARHSGKVSVFYGDPGGMIPVVELDQDGLDTNEDGDRFGAAVAISDLAHDGVPLEVSVGAPHKDVTWAVDAGAVYFFRDSGAGLVAWKSLDETHPSCPEPSGPQPGDELGFSEGVAPRRGDAMPPPCRRPPGVEAHATVVRGGDGLEGEGRPQQVASDALEALAVAAVDPGACAAGGSRRDRRGGRATHRRRPTDAGARTNPLIRLPGRRAP